MKTSCTGRNGARHRAYAALALRVAARRLRQRAPAAIDTVAVNGDVADRLREARQHDGPEPDRRHAVRGRRRPDACARSRRPSALEHNVTAAFTQGNGDASDPEVSYDGKKIVFSMRCPTTQHVDDRRPAGLHRRTGTSGSTTLTTGGLAGGTFRRLTAPTDRRRRRSGLPAGRPRLRVRVEPPDQVEDQPGGGPQPYFALDEYERERVLNLHTMDDDGGNITQISVNQSHDRNPVVRAERRHHVLALGARRRRATASRSSASSPTAPTCSCSTARRAAGNSFLHPRDMDPNGPVRRLQLVVVADVAVGHAGRRRADVASTPPTTPSRTRRPTRRSPPAAASARPRSRR